MWPVDMTSKCVEAASFSAASPALGLPAPAARLPQKPLSNVTAPSFPSKCFVVFLAPGGSSLGAVVWVLSVRDQPFRGVTGSRDVLCHFGRPHFAPSL